MKAMRILVITFSVAMICCLLSGCGCGKRKAEAPPPDEDWDSEKVEKTFFSTNTLNSAER